jgi:hypothetical protein
MTARRNAVLKLDSRMLTRDTIGTTNGFDSSTDQSLPAFVSKRIIAGHSSRQNRYRREFLRWTCRDPSTVRSGLWPPSPLHTSLYLDHGPHASSGRSRGSDDGCPNPPFQGCLAMQLSRLKSAKAVDIIALLSKSIWDGLGRFRLFSTVRWSCIGRAKLPSMTVFAVQCARRLEFANLKSKLPVCP